MKAMKLSILFQIQMTMVAFGSALAQSPTAFWQPLPNSPLLEANERHDDVFFVNPDIGWVVNINGEIYKTVDGGETWSLQLTRERVFFRSVGFADSRTGWAGNLGFSNRLNNPDLLFETRDGGASWTNITGRVNGPAPTGICGISVVNERVIYAVGRWAPGPTHFIKSTDGGLNWTSKEMTDIANPLVDVYFFDEMVGIAVGGTVFDTWDDLDSTRGVIIMTEDGGDSWERTLVTSNTREWGWKISFPTPSVGYATFESPERAKVAKTVDGGKTWQEIRIDDHTAVSAVGFLNDQIGWTGGHGVVPFLTTDGGNTWKEDPFGENINRIRFLSDTLGFAAGRRVYKFSAGEVTSVPDLPSVPRTMVLKQNFPNPFNPVTVIHYQLPHQLQIELAVFDVAGRKVRVLSEGLQTAGMYAVEWAGTDENDRPVSSGMYIYRLKAGNQVQVKKMLFLK